MTTIIEVTIGGLLLGAVYGLGAFGMAMIFGVLRMLNLAHGAFMVAGGAVAWALGRMGGHGLLLSVPVVLGLTYGGGMLLAHWGLVPAEPERETHAGELADLSGHLLVTLGCALVVEDLITRWSPQGVFALPLESGMVHIAGVTVSVFKLVLLVLVAGVFAAFSLMLRKTDYGLMIRAITEDRIGALLTGIPLRRLYLTVFATGSAMAGLAGALLMMLYPVRAHMAIPLTIKALLVVVLGGMGRVFYSFIAALVLGLAEVFTGYWGSTEAQVLIPYGAMVTILLLWPEGIGSIQKNR